MKNYYLVTFLILLSMVASSVHARKPKVLVEAGEYVNKALPDEGTVWLCWYDGSQAIQCRPDEAMEDEGFRNSSPAVARPDLRFPEIVSKAWNKASELAEKLVSIPLHTIPIDMALTGELAEAVICSGATKPCGVIFARNAGLLSDLVDMRNIQVARRMLTSLVGN
jgi:hypothetical protein